MHDVCVVGLLQLHNTQFDAYVHTNVVTQSSSSSASYYPNRFARSPAVADWTREEMSDESLSPGLGLRDN